MRAHVLGLGLTALVGCSTVFGLNEPVRLDATVDVRPDDSAAVDASVDAALVLSPWGNVTQVFANTDADDPSLTDDQLEMYLEISGQLFVSTRTSTAVPWPAPTLLTNFSTAATETTPEITRNGLGLVYASNRTGTLGLNDLWFAIRNTRATAWSSTVHWPDASSTANDYAGPFDDLGTLVVFASNRAPSSGFDLWEITRPSVASTMWSSPTRIASLATGDDELSPFLAGDRNTMYFGVTRSNPAETDLYVATKTNGVWSTVQPITELNSTETDTDPWVSPDGLVMYFASARGDGRMRIYSATRAYVTP